MQANIYNNMSTCYTIEEDNENALNLSLRAKNIYKTLDETKSLGNSYGTIANIYNNITYCICLALAIISQVCCQFN